MFTIGISVSGSLKYKKKKVLYFETAELFELKLFKNNG
jgi:hypothetical protein